IAANRLMLPRRQHPGRCRCVADRIYGQDSTEDRRQAGHLTSIEIPTNWPTIAMNAGEFEWANNRTTMASSTSIAKKARSKAEADFATWLMMAKLGSFDDLPPNAQKLLTNYRARLEMMSEAESTVLAVREVYSVDYSGMGGVE